MLKNLTQPEYLHILLNPMPIYGLSIAVLALAITLVRRNRAGQVLALWLVFLAAGSAWPTYGYGEDAYHRVYLIADGDGQEWLDHHMHRAEKAIYVYYAAAAAALLAVLLPRKIPGSALPLTILTFLLALAALGAGGWIAHAGGKVRHSEFRAPDPEAELEPEPEAPTNEPPEKSKAPSP